MKTKVGIVEDELLISENIAETLEALGYEVIDPVISYNQAIVMIEEHNPDILLLDIQIAGQKDGIELAEKIKKDYGLPYIFLTANSDAKTVERAKRLNPPAFLVKPFKKEDLYSSIEICLHNFSGKQAPLDTHAEPGDNYIVKDSVFVKQNQYFHKVKISDILYLESDKNYIFVHTAGEKLWIRTSFQDFIDLTGSKSLMRVHKGYVVNAEKITAINTDRILLDKIEIPIGKQYRDDLLHHLKLS